MQLNDILNRLDKVTQRGDQHTALCPAHDDKNPSLAITERDGKILLKCWSGCTTNEITNSLGIKVSDLFIDSNIKPLQSQTYHKKKTIKQCWESLEFEIHILYQCIVQRIHRNTPLSEQDVARESIAIKRINKLIGELYVA